jgi:hypothetical protein
MPEKADSIDGRLPETKTDLYVVPSVINFHIESIILVNNHETEAVTAELWVKRKGGKYSRRIVRKYSIPPTADAQEHRIFIPLRSGDTIEGKASTGEMVDYVISYYSEQ